MQNQQGGMCILHITLHRLQGSLILLVKKDDALETPAICHVCSE